VNPLLWLPLAFFVLGLAVFLIFGVCMASAERRYGESGFFEGVMGLAACLICWAIAGGLLVSDLPA
jgi:uncharacterized membrane protein YvlD (DUF360 family)